MTTESVPTPTTVRALFRWLVDIGLEPPRHHADPVTGEAAILAAAEAYADEFADDGVTSAELRAAARAYIRKPLAHGGRCPWPNAGMLIAVVAEHRVSLIPIWGDPDVGTSLRTIISRAWMFPERGLDVSMVPEAARDLMAEAITEARAVHRRDDRWEFVERDVQKAYEARRARRGGAK